MLKADNTDVYSIVMRRLLQVKHAVVVLCAVLLDGAALAEDSDNLCGGKQSSGYLDVSGSKLYYEECGSGPAIVLLHDGLLHAVSWDGVWQPLAAKYHVIRYDRRGYGRSGPAASSFSPTEDLLKLLTHLKVKHAVVAGSSSGGALAIDFAIAHPQMVDGLFLIGPVLHGMSYTEHFRERGRRNSEPMQRDDTSAVAKNWAEDKFLIFGGNERTRRRVYDELIANPQNLRYPTRFEQELSPPANKRLSEIKAPTVILVGEADIADVHAHCGAINAGVQESARLIVKEAGHLVQLENPDEVTKRLEDFGERCARK